MSAMLPPDLVRCSSCERISRVPELPRGACAVILRTLAKDPEGRPTADELRREFVAAAEAAVIDDTDRGRVAKPTPDAARREAP